MSDNELKLGTISVSLVLDGDNTSVRIELPEGDLSNVQMLGMLELARHEVLHPEEGQP